MGSGAMHQPTLTKAYQAAAGRLIRDRLTLVLATGKKHQPWCTPVYYVYMSPGFYFYSSRNARHSQHIRNQSTCAAAIFTDGENWEDIQGIQMNGTVIEVDKKTEKIKATAHYLAKFPFAAKFFSNSETNVLNLAKTVEMYLFSPIEAYYTNNRLGFGQRVLVTLS